MSPGSRERSVMRLTVVPRLGVRLASSNKVAGQRVRWRLSFTRSFRFRGATRRWSRFYAFLTSCFGRC